MAAAKKTVKVTTPWHKHEDGKHIQGLIKQVDDHNKAAQKAYSDWSRHWEKGKDLMANPKTMEKGFDHIRESHKHDALEREHAKAGEKLAKTIAKPSKKFLETHHPVGSKVVHNGKVRTVGGHHVGKWDGEPYLHLKGVNRARYTGRSHKRTMVPLQIHAADVKKVVE